MINNKILVILFCLSCYSCNQRGIKKINTHIKSHKDLTIYLGMQESQIKELYKNKVFKPDYGIENGYDFKVVDTLNLYNNEPIQALLFFYFKKKILTALHTLMFVEKKDTLPMKNYFDSCFNKKIIKDSTAVIGDIEIRYNPDLKGWNLDSLHTCISYRIKLS